MEKALEYLNKVDELLIVLAGKNMLAEDAREYLERAVKILKGESDA